MCVHLTGIALEVCFQSGTSMHDSDKYFNDTQFIYIPNVRIGISIIHLAVLIILHVIENYIH